MAARLLHSLTDDNQDLQKQIGCVNGIYQVFDRQNILTSGRRSVGPSTKPKRPPLGNSHLNSGTLDREFDNTHLRSSLEEKFSHKNMVDRQRVSTESSRASFSSSSRSSSFSSLDRMVFPETPSRDPPTSLQNSSAQFSRQSVDLRDFVKDSIYREVQGLSEALVPVVKHRNSPKQQSKISDGSSLDKKQRTPADVKESLRHLQSSYHYEPRELSRSSSYHSKDSSSFSISKDAPRFSYDGREINSTRFDLHDGSTSTLKLKDLPRLSLDNREGSMRNLSADSKSNYFSKPLQMDNRSFDGKIQIPQHSPLNQARPPSVVAKLMGLETLPDSISCGDTNTGSCRSYPDEDFLSASSSFRTNPSKKEISSPRWSNSGCSMKPMSKFPLEPAPWKQTDGTNRSHKPASKSTRDPAKALTTYPSVYSEIEKRLKDVEFTQSGKDLRALKQILEAMQSKGLLETPKEGQGSNFNSHKEHEQTNISSTMSVDNRKRHSSDQGYVSTKMKTVTAQNYVSPIVIMKPTKMVEKSSVPAASVISLHSLSGRRGESIDNRKGVNSGIASKDLTSKSSHRECAALNSVNMKNDKTLKATQSSSSARSHQLAKENKNSGSISPRMPLKKAELEKRSRPPTPPDSSKSKRQLNKQQQSESNSPGGRRRPKNPHSQQIDDKSSVESRNTCSHENEDSNEFADVSSNQSPSMKASTEFMISGLVEKKSTLMASEEESAEFGFVPPEYSSPVSVLNNIVYKHDALSPSPVKCVAKTLKVDISMGNDRNSNVIQQRSSVNSTVFNSKELSAKSDMNRKKLENIDNLVQKLRRLNSSHDEARTDYIASLCENTNPDHRYISEILLASGLLLSSTLTDFQFHPSGHPINPDLFLVLEQTKASSSSKDEYRTKKSTPQSEKLHRKLIFDSVNEILARKLMSTGPNSDPWSRQFKLARKTMNAQKLLRELCSEIEGLQANKAKCSSDEELEDEGWKNILCNDVMYGSERWIGFDDEISGAVLEIERLIFKDLVNEIVLGESAGLITKPGVRKRLGK